MIQHRRQVVERPVHLQRFRLRGRQGRGRQGRRRDVTMRWGEGRRRAVALLLVGQARRRREERRRLAAAGRLPGPRRQRHQTVAGGAAAPFRVERRRGLASLSHHFELAGAVDDRSD